MDIVFYNGVAYELLPNEYWYIVPTGTSFEQGVKRLGIVRHNARLGGGIHIQISKLPGGKNFRFQVKNDVEQKFEEIRQAHYLNKPSRFECWYLSESQTLAEKRIRGWFRGPFDVVRCRILKAEARIHRADVKLFEMCSDHYNERLVHDYWKGGMSDGSEVEVLVDAALYFPDWEKFPLLDLTTLGRLR